LALAVLEQPIREVTEAFLFMLQLVAEALPEPLLRPAVEEAVLLFRRGLGMQYLSQEVRAEALVAQRQVEFLVQQELLDKGMLAGQLELELQGAAAAAAVRVV
jgi:hypothetical protein